MSMGSVLREEIDAMGISEHELATDLGIDENEIDKIIHDEMSIDLILAEKFGRYFNTSPDVWLDVQYNLNKHGG